MTLIQRIILGTLFIIPIFAMGFFIAQGDEEPFVTETENAYPTAQQNLPKVANTDTLPPNHPDPQAQVQAMITELEAKIDQNQHEFKDLLLLARAYTMVQDYQGAVSAFEKALLVEPNSIDVLLPLADVLAVVQGGKLTGRPYELLQQVLKMDPNVPMALWLIGNAEMQLDNKDKAAEYWTRLYYLFPEGSENQTKVGEQLESIGKRPAKTASATTPQASNTVASNATTNSAPSNQPILITLDITPEIKEKLKGTTVFIYAKSQTGMPMPIAAKKIPGEQLTSAITLTEADQLRPDRALKDVAKIKIGIKISHQKNVDDKTEIFRAEENLSDSRKINFKIQF